MIDIHTNILPGVDDGPRSMESSLEILRKAAGADVTTVVATPHVVDIASAYNVRGIGDALASVKKRLVQEGVDIELLQEPELFLAYDLGNRLNEQKDLTINGTGRYVLVEPSVYDIPLYTEQTFFDLCLQGFVPILAHPERYFDIQKKPGSLPEGNRA
ncbi:CpsB/CapC family capsule biosynthesis tyrosine phosphatase [Thermodesulfobacteriota bacterium]